MEPTKCQLNQEDTDLVGFKNLTGSSSSSSSSSNGSTSSDPTTVQYHLDKLLASVDPNMTPQELLEASCIRLAKAKKEAKEARALANEKALKAAKGVAKAKEALEYFNRRFSTNKTFDDFKVPN